ncbi:MAG: hypothetical protein ACFE0Q_15080 [Anaerolineae bacterium]
MNISKQTRRAVGWRGQALAEYHVFIPLMALVIIVIGGYLGETLAGNYQKVNECFEGATRGVIAEGCEDERRVVNNPELPEESDDTPDNNNNPDNPPADTNDNPSNPTNPPADGGEDEENEEEETPNEGGNPNGDGGGTDTSGDTENPNYNDGSEDPDGQGEDEVVQNQCPPDADFNGLPAGTILTNQFAGMTITTHDPNNHPAMIFDTSNPTGGDPDLGTPNSDFGGPGHGQGGRSGAPGENSVPLGNVVIISEDGNSNDPDDNARGGQIIFEFDYPANVTYIYFLDQDNGGVAATVTLYDENNSTLNAQQVNVPNGGGDNGVFRVDLDTSGVYRMVASLPGSGAIASVFFCEDPNSDPIGSETPAEDEGFSPECGQEKAVIIEPREDNAQHVMVQYPVVCDDEGNPVDDQPGAGVSNMSIALGSNSYIDASLSGHLQGDFEAWCVDYENPIYAGRSYTGDNYNDPAVSVDRPQNLPLINWLINYDWQSNGYSITDVQGAIWLLIDSTPIERSDLGPNSEALAQMAIAAVGDSSTDNSIRINEPSEPTLVFVTEMEPDTTNGTQGGRWRAQVTVTVRDDLGQPVDGVTVRVDFSRGGTNKTCNTNGNGECTITSNNIQNRHSSSTATMDTITNTNGLSYSANNNQVSSVVVER